MNKFSKFPAEVIGEMHPLFKGFQWVSAAVSDDATRYVINCVKVEHDDLVCRLIATDGRRLHVHTFDPGMFNTDIDMVVDGLYEVIVKTAKLIVIAPSELDVSTYPNWRQVLPSYRLHRSLTVDKRSIGRLGIATGVLLAVDFASDALGFGCGFKKDDAVEVRFGSPDPTDAFLLEHELGQAVVMPLRMTDENAEPMSDVEATPNLPGVEQEEG